MLQNKVIQIDTDTGTLSRQHVPIHRLVRDFGHVSNESALETWIAVATVGANANARHLQNIEIAGIGKLIASEFARAECHFVAKHAGHSSKGLPHKRQCILLILNEINSDRARDRLGAVARTNTI